MDKRKIRDILRLGGALCFSALYIPHIISYAVGGGKNHINSDFRRLSKQVEIKMPLAILLLFLLQIFSYIVLL